MLILQALKTYLEIKTWSLFRVSDLQHGSEVILLSSEGYRHRFGGMKVDPELKENQPDKIYH